jgi:hypothetical protein
VAILDLPHAAPALKLSAQRTDAPPFPDGIRLEVRAYTRHAWSSVLRGWDDPLGGVRVGIYALWQKGVTLYVGQSTNVRRRILAHGTRKPFTTVFVMPCEREDLDQLEREAIARLDPPWNKVHRRGREVLPTFMLPPEAL